MSIWETVKLVSGGFLLLLAGIVIAKKKRDKWDNIAGLGFGVLGTVLVLSGAGLLSVIFGGC